MRKQENENQINVNRWKYDNVLRHFTELIISLVVYGYWSARIIK